MIPQFPEFKKIERSDKDDIEAFTRHFPPYSDFNFVSMWSWDVQGDVRLSELNGNLVARFSDYLTGEPFYSFLGTTKVNETAKTLLDVAKSVNTQPCLRLIPEEVAKLLDRGVFDIEEDRNNHDYVIPLRVFENYATKHTENKRKSVKKLLKEFVVHTETLDLCDPKSKALIYDLFHKWSEGKDDPLEVQNELRALERFLENNCGATNHICTGIYINGTLAAFCISELQNGAFSTIHFCKADTTIASGVYAFVLQENAKKLKALGHEHVNLEQDLGIDNMRQWKMSHGEHVFLKKYTVQYPQRSRKLADL